MDGSHFDAIAKTLRRAESRRELLGVLAALPVSGLLATVGLEESDARRKGKGRKRSHRPGKHKQNHKNKRKPKVGDQPDCPGVLTRAGCTQVQDQALGVTKWQCRAGANLRGADLSGCRLEHADLHQAQLQNAFLNRAVLNDADLRSARLDSSTVDGATAVNARFDSAVLYKASVANTDLRNANFENADLRLRDWGRTTCPNGRTLGASHPTCCTDLNGHTAKYCGKA